MTRISRLYRFYGRAAGFRLPISVLIAPSLQALGRYCLPTYINQFSAGTS